MFENHAVKIFSKFNYHVAVYIQFYIYKLNTSDLNLNEQEKISILHNLLYMLTEQ
jgi:hypothetical protein